MPLHLVSPPAAAAKLAAGVRTSSRGHELLRASRRTSRRVSLSSSSSREQSAGRAMATTGADASTTRETRPSGGVKQALISLSDKTGLTDLGNGLQRLGFSIISTGGTASSLEAVGVNVTKVEEITHFPEMLDGRVKTLHPSIHGGILARRDQEHHLKALDEHGIVANRRNWNVLNWNVRGINSDKKCNAVRAKIEESSCSIFCLQETKRHTFDPSAVRRMSPKRFNKFAYSPAQGTSGGIFVGWTGSTFDGMVISSGSFQITIQFTALCNAERWFLVVVYGPCQGQERQSFMDWLGALQIADDENWMIVGDFNFYRSTQNRNRDGGNLQDILAFNGVISTLGLQEIPLKGRSYTWSNMQQDPLLEQLDWCFTSPNWISDYPNTLMLPLAKPTSDHVPCMIQIGTTIPKAQLFRLENHWLDQPDFVELVQTVWKSEIRATNSATRVASKFKLLRRVLRRWGQNLFKLKGQIKHCNLVLATLDKLEENRPLVLQERNFRKILKTHIAKLLQRQKSYWQKRYTVRWTKLGDESTKFFHAAATERYRINTITSLDTSDGRVITDHFEKAGLLWDEYKSRLGCTAHVTMQFNLQQLVQEHDLAHLEEPFLKEEIDQIIKNLNPDKAPGPDGFNGAFLKKCWSIIRDDIYELCFDFFNGIIDLQSINNSFITLVPKVNTPSTVNDFRPISLINCIVKIITKLLGNRLQSVIIPLIHQNQYGFIKTRSIQDCLAWAFEYIHQCKQSRRQIVILKLDFTKAFDTIEHSAILEMMHHLGFGDKWLKWTRDILQSATTAVLLNGVPGKSINCKRGVRQGDPLSPLLFVIAADLLQCVINRAFQQGLLQMPISSRDGSGFPIIQYADDTIIFLRASQRELLCLKALLETFGQSTGLRVNYSKSGMIPLNISEQHAEYMAGVFGCQIQGLPFPYLGLPMGSSKPKFEHFAPLMDRVERRLTGISSMLTHAGKLQLVNSVLSSLPTYTMCSVMIPVEALEYVERARRNCMWRKSDSNGKNQPLVAWRKCTKPKRKGGLGIVNMRSQNEALLLKHLDKFYNKKDIPWVNLIWNSYYANGEVPHATKKRVSFWWRDILKLVDKFRGVATCRMGNGSTVLFWSDVWNDNLLQHKYPRLYSYAKHKDISVAQFLLNNSIQEQFHLPLSDEAYQEYQQLQFFIDQLHVSTSKDSWHYIWGSDKYSSSKFYHHPFKCFKPPAPFLWIWDSKCSNKIKVFTWLLLMDRLNVRNILRRKKQKLEGNNYSCPLCSANREETTFHLFFSCTFSIQCWNHLGIIWDFSLPFHQMMERAKQFFGPFFMEIFMLGTWLIWKQRNDLIFNRGQATFQRWKFGFIEESTLQSNRMNQQKQSSFLSVISLYS